MSKKQFKRILISALVQYLANMSDSLSVRGVSPSRQRGISSNGRSLSSHRSSILSSSSHGDRNYITRLNDTKSMCPQIEEDGKDFDNESCSTNNCVGCTMPNTLYRTLLQRAGEIVSGSNGQQLLISISLFATYFTVMAAKCALPTTLNLITSDDSGLSLDNLDTSPQQIIARVLTLSTCTIALGKFLLGPIVDKFGGILCLKVALSSLMGLLAIISYTNSFKIMSVALVGIDFIFSSCWAACLNAIHQSFRQDKWSSCVGLLAVAARTGNAFAFFFFASLLHWSQQRRMKIGGLVGESWRNVFLASALIQAIPLILLTIGSRNNFGDSLNHDGKTIESEELTILVGQSQKYDQTLSTHKKTSIRQSIHVLQKEARTATFWMHLVSRSCLMIVASFLLFVPSYMTNAFGLSSADSARVGSLYSVGCLISVSIGSKYFSAISTRRKIVTTIVLLGIQVIVSALQCLHALGVVSISALAGTLSMFLWGIGFAVPFYIPPSLFALKRGGKESSATIADAFDFTGFVMLAVFNGFVASRKQDILISWYIPFIITSGCGLVSLVSLAIGLCLEDRDQSIK